MDHHAKADALEFLRALHARLNTTLPAPAEMHGQVADLIELGRNDARYRHLCSAEHAFTRGIALPRVYEELTGAFGLSAEDAKKALLSEGWTNFKEISSGTPARTVRHPFDKAMASDAWSIYQKWMRKASRLPLTQSCPDFALRSPAPHKVVFEAKYFTGGSPRKAARDLVTDLYQAFFYRALPPIGGEQERSWDYDYACLFAYDASTDGAFEGAWEALDHDVKEGFWFGANVYVMVLRGS